MPRSVPALVLDDRLHCGKRRRQSVIGELQLAEGASEGASAVGVAFEIDHPGTVDRRRAELHRASVPVS